MKEGICLDEKCNSNCSNLNAAKKFKSIIDKLTEHLMDCINNLTFKKQLSYIPNLGIYAKLVTNIYDRIIISIKSIKIFYTFLLDRRISIINNRSPSTPDSRAVIFLVRENQCAYRRKIIKEDNLATKFILNIQKNRSNRPTVPNRIKLYIE